MFVGWGTVPQFTEFSAEGDVLWHVHLEKYLESEGLANMQNYRVFKAPWVGKPRTEPKLVAYRQRCEDGPLMGYVSWNGATEVKWWRFSVGDGSGKGSWRKGITIKRDGFETRTMIKQGGDSAFGRWVKVEALDEKYSVLSSTVTETFVPSQEVFEGCDELSCAVGHEWFEYEESQSDAALCPIKTQGTSGTWLMMVSALVAVAFVVRFILKKRSEQGRRTTAEEMEMFVGLEKPRTGSQPRETRG